MYLFMYVIYVTLYQGYHGCRVLFIFLISLSPSLSLSLPGVPPITVNMEAGALSPGARSTVTVPPPDTAEPPATAVRKQAISARAGCV